jgi:hypothetical protein
MSGRRRRRQEPSTTFIFQAQTTFPRLRSPKPCACRPTRSCRSPTSTTPSSSRSGETSGSLPTTGRSRTSSISPSSDSRIRTGPWGSASDPNGGDHDPAGVPRANAFRWRGAVRVPEPPGRNPRGSPYRLRRHERPRGGVPDRSGSSVARSGVQRAVPGTVTAHWRRISTGPGIRARVRPASRWTVTRAGADRPCLPIGCSCQSRGIRCRLQLEGPWKSQPEPGSRRCHVR